MGMYGDVSIRATTDFLLGKSSSPQEAWDGAVAQISTSLSSRKKSCPRKAYLGLCEAGVISGIPAGKYGVRSDNKNGQYALNAYRILRSKPSLVSDKATLWAKATAPENKKQNEQMDVVVSLWDKKLLRP